LIQNPQYPEQTLAANKAWITKYTQEEISQRAKKAAKKAWKTRRKTA